MAEPEAQPDPVLVKSASLLSQKIDALHELADATLNALGKMQELYREDASALRAIGERVLPVMQGLNTNLVELSTDVSKLRSVMLGKLDGLQGTVDLVRQDVRNSWSTADFAITNSRNAREETDKVLSLISTMQRQQQLLTSQVDELRKAAAEKEAGN